MKEPSREAFEKWAVGILGDNPNWCESGDCELAWQSWRASRETEQAQAVEPIGYVRHADKTFWPHPECAVYASVSPSLAPVYAHPAPLVQLVTKPDSRPQNCGTGHCSCIECPYPKQKV
jgi:hypothetical protein